MMATCKILVPNYDYSRFYGRFNIGVVGGGGVGGGRGYANLHLRTLSSGPPFSKIAEKMVTITWVKTNFQE